MRLKHKVISNIVEDLRDNLPKWFTDKYEDYIEFDMKYWVSYDEYERKGDLANFNEDIQKVLTEIYDGESDDPYEVKLIYFNNESNVNSPGVIHTHITTESITEIEPQGWDGIIFYIDNLKLKKQILVNLINGDIYEHNDKLISCPFGTGEVILFKYWGIHGNYGGALSEHMLDAMVNDDNLKKVEAFD
jgi:hypothetical protein